MPVGPQPLRDSAKLAVAAILRCRKALNFARINYRLKRSRRREQHHGANDAALRRYRRKHEIGERYPW